MTTGMTVEERLVRIETRLDGFEKNFATKADLAELKWQMLGALMTVGALVVVAVRYLP